MTVPAITVTKVSNDALTPNSAAAQSRREIFCLPTDVVSSRVITQLPLSENAEGAGISKEMGMARTAKNDFMVGEAILLLRQFRFGKVKTRA